MISHSKKTSSELLMLKISNMLFNFVFNSVCSSYIRIAHCPKYYLNLCIKTMPVKVGAEATVYEWFLSMNSSQSNDQCTPLQMNTPANAFEKN